MSSTPSRRADHRLSSPSGRTTSSASPSGCGATCGRSSSCRAGAAAPAGRAGMGGGEDRLVLATGRYVGEGFDDARLDTLFLAMPISWKGTLQQYVGRLHRLHDSKRVLEVYDFVDAN